MSMTTTVSFPSLGIDPFTLNKVAFSIGSLQIRWYGILITLGIVLAFLYAGFRGKRNENFIADDVIDIGLFTVSFGVIGARLYYVLTTLDEYDYSSFLKVIAVWEGGLAIYGGIIGGCLGIVTACLIKKKNWLRAFDMIGPGVMLAQAIGRWGNFFNGEAHGYAIYDTTRFYFLNTEHILPSGEGTFFHALRMGLSRTGTLSGSIYYYHPTFLYECVWNLVGFALINLFYKHKKFNGQIALMYFTWYGFGRMLIEGFRSDSLYIPGTTLRISQCIGLACALLGASLLLALSFRKHYPALLCPALGLTPVSDPCEDTEKAAEPMETAEAEEPQSTEEADTPTEEADAPTEEPEATDKPEESEDKSNGTAD